MILYNSENNIRDIRLFYRPLFSHSSAVKYTSTLLQQRTRSETWLLDEYYWNHPPNLTGWIRPCLSVLCSVRCLEDITFQIDWLFMDQSEISASVQNQDFFVANLKS